MTHSTHKTTHFTMPAILPAILTGLFILTACGGGALPNDGKIAPNTQNNACKTNPLAEDCQANAGFLSVGLDEGIGNQEAESSVAPPAPKPVVNTPVVKKTEPVLKELAKKKTQPAPAPEPITSVDTSGFVPKTSYSTYSAPAEQRSGSAVSGDSGASGQQSASVTAAVAFSGRSLTRDATPANEFLRGGATELDRGDVVRHQPLRMNLAEATYDGVKIKGDAKNGIDFFTVRGGTDATHAEGGNPYLYAGILANTDLGAPLNTTDPTATWNGSFRTQNSNAVDFQLTVNFGTTDQDRTISAFVKDSIAETTIITYTFRNVYGGQTSRDRAIEVNNYYLLEGTYNENGVITGTVNWGKFKDIAMRTPTDGETPGTPRATNGTLTGLIGADGAVGAFYSDRAKNVETRGGYVGGFVASPSATGNPNVRSNDWTAPTVTGRGGFMAGGAYALDTVDYSLACAEHNRANTTFPFVMSESQNVLMPVKQIPNCPQPEAGSLNFVTATHGPSEDMESGDTIDNSISKVATGGVAFFGSGISLEILNEAHQSFAGILSGTDLGRPLAAGDTVGAWKGQFKSVGGYYYHQNGVRYQKTALDTDFILTVTFSGGTGTVEAFVPIDDATSRYFLLTGTYDNKGVITGDVRASVFTGRDKTRPTTSTDNGVLTGLIGVHGAVGAFVSDQEANYSYAGGFVAAPPPAPVVFVPTPDNTAGVVSYADWVYGQELSSQEHLSFTANTETLKNEFLAIRTGDTKLDEAGLATTTTTRRYSPDLTTIGRTVDGTGGFSIFTHGGFAYAGILPNTDLGAPLGVKDVATTWRGAFYAVGGYDIDQNGFDTNVNGPFLRPADFLLEITFGGTDFGAIKGSFEISPASLADQARGNVYFLLEGTFNAGGYITGTVNFGKFDNGNLDTPAGGRATNGVLTGIIGKNGAVGAFISNPVPVDEPSTGDRNFIYSGGFAVARDNKPNYATFREFYTPRSDTRELHATHPATGDSGRFIEGTPTGLVTNNFDLGGNGYGPAVVRLGEVASDHADYGSGFAVMRDTNNRYRVGLLSGTDLGASLDADVTANWSGKIYRLTHTVRRGDALTSNDLTLTVDFANGTINTTDTTVRGRFNTGSRNTDLPFGILDGSVNYGSVNVLAGLIGEKGVLGVFHGGVNGLHAGGFYATPDVESVSYTFAETATTYSHWTAALTGVDNARNPQLASGSAAGDFGNNQYITLEDMTNDIKVVASGTIVQDDLMLDGSAVSGVVFGVHPADGQSFVSLLPTTNVGGAITGGPAKATWSGSLKGIATFGDVTLSSANFELEVAFGAGSHAGTITTLNRFNTDIAGPTGITQDEFGSITNPSFNVNGDFNTAGVMWGAVGLGDGANNGVFSGLIGENGAVGAFRGADGNGGYAGGFVVKPPSN